MLNIKAENYAGKECVIVGGNQLALQYGLVLNAEKAVLHIVAEEIDEQLWWMAIDSGGSALLKDLDQNDLPGRDLLIVVEANASEQQQAKAWAEAAAVDIVLAGDNNV